MRITISDTDELSEHVRKARHKTWIVVLSCVLGIGIVISILESSNPGTIAGLLSVARDLVVAIWRMICDVANACSGFINYVLNIRSS